MQFGFHLTLDLYNCPIEKLQSMESVYDSMDLLPAKINMHALIKPIVVNAAGNNIKYPGGFSGFIIIQESHISVHTFIKRGFVSIDIYSCKTFDKEVAKKHFEEIFKPAKIEEHYIDRGLYYPDSDIY